MPQDTNEVLGVDIGQVLVEQEPEDPNLSFFGANFLESPELPDAFRVLRRLHDERFGDNIWLITRCSRPQREKRLLWLKHHSFFMRTGVLEEKHRYCFSPYNKADVCNDLHITHFVDDQPSELVHLGFDVPNLILFRPKEAHVKEHERFVAQSTIRLESWNEIEKLLLP